MNTQKDQATRFSIILALLLVAPTVLSLGYNVYIDPFQLYAADPHGEASFLGDQGRDRYQPAGIIRHYKPGSIILGNSWAANFYPTHVEQTLNWENTFSLTLDGGSLHEQSTIARFALRHAPVEHAIWLLSPHNFDADVDSTHRKLPFPDYLYNDVEIDDLRLYVTAPTNIRKYSEMKRRKRDQLLWENRRQHQHVDARDRATEWGSIKWRKFDRPVEILQIFLGADFSGKTKLESVQSSSWLSEQDVAALRPGKPRQQRISANLERNILPLLEGNPQVQFHFIIQPPFSYLYWQSMKARSAREYYDSLYTTRMFVDDLSGFTNVKIYAFGDLPSNADLRLYKDEHHFHRVVNHYMIQLMSREEHILTTDNVAAYLSNFDRLVTQYNPNISYWIEYSGKGGNRTGLGEREARAILRTYDSSNL